MAELHETAASLRISGDDLDPDEVTALLGQPPALSYRKGDLIVLPNGREPEGRRRTGMWSVRAQKMSPADLDAQVEELLSGLSQDLAVWKALSERFEMDLFCGLFMQEGNEGLGLSPKTLLALGARGIEIDLDIYAPSWRDLQEQERALEDEWVERPISPS